MAIRFAAPSCLGCTGDCAELHRPSHSGQRRTLGSDLRNGHSSGSLRLEKRCFGSGPGRILAAAGSCRINDHRDWRVCRWCRRSRSRTSETPLEGSARLAPTRSESHGTRNHNLRQITAEHICEGAGDRPFTDSISNTRRGRMAMNATLDSSKANRRFIILGGGAWTAGRHPGLCRFQPRLQLRRLPVG